ncbi:glycosyltransferase family 8 protein [bacterium]|nr:glycosyltransferase family 8 protein [bacterium]
MKKYIIIFVLLLLAVSIVSAGVYFGLKFKKNTVPTVIKDNKTAHIVFTTDKNYAKYLHVALFSAIKNKKADSVYDISIICVDLTEKERNYFKKFEQNNVNIRTIPVSLEEIKFGDYKIFNERVTRADLFKFLMPKIFNNYKKILYLDADILVRGDLLDLYNIDIGNYYLAAALKYSPHTEMLELPFRRFIWLEYNYNCGVMLLNLEKMRKNDITKKLIKAKEQDKDKALMSQTSFNEVMPTKKVIKLNPIYNFYARLSDDDFRYFELKKIYAPYLNDINSTDEFAKEAVIVHFAGPTKPWYDNDVKILHYSEEWRKYAKMENPNWKSDGYKYHPVDY